MLFKIETKNPPNIYENQSPDSTKTLSDEIAFTTNLTERISLPSRNLSSELSKTALSAYTESSLALQQQRLLQQIESAISIEHLLKLHRILPLVSLSSL